MLDYLIIALIIIVVALLSALAIYKDQSALAGLMIVVLIWSLSIDTKGRNTTTLNGKTTTNQKEKDNE